MVQVGSHATHCPLSVISFELVQLEAHLYVVVSTRPELQAVQVEVVPAHLSQLESHATHVVPLTMVLSVSHELTHVLVLKSSLLLPLQEVQVVVDPEQVLQFELHAVQV